MDYLWFRWTLGWNHQLKKTCLLVGWLMTVSGDVCTCCIFSLNWPIRVRESRFVAENQWSDWSPRILKIPLPNQVIKVKYSNIRLQIFELILSNPNQTFWIFVKPESRFWEANIRFSLHWKFISKADEQDIWKVNKYLNSTPINIFILILEDEVTINE